MDSFSATQQSPGLSSSLNESFVSEEWPGPASTAPPPGPGSFHQPYYNVLLPQDQMAIDLDHSTSTSSSVQAQSSLYHPNFAFSSPLPSPPYADGWPNQQSSYPCSYPQSPVDQNQLEDDAMTGSPSPPRSVSLGDSQAHRRERRKAQNRAAQRAFRARQVERVKEGDTTIEQLAKKVQWLEQENSSLSWRLQTTKEDLRKLEHERKHQKDPSTSEAGVTCAFADYGDVEWKQVDLVGVANGIF